MHLYGINVCLYKGEKTELALKKALFSYAVCSMQTTGGLECTHSVHLKGGLKLFRHRDFKNSDKLQALKIPTLFSLGSKNSDS